jgi:hypothetical protein
MSITCRGRESGEEGECGRGGRVKGREREIEESIYNDSAIDLDYILTGQPTSRKAGRPRGLISTLNIQLHKYRQT